MEQTTPKYFAFISYSSADKVWAKRLQKKLEQYRLPTRLQKKYRDVSRRAYPICRDDTAIAGFKVWTSLTELLDDSKFLIVICTPHSARSEWVNKEIQYFIDHGKENQIMPFIVEGVPHSGDPETECFPQALLNMKEDPLGVDVTALGKRKAYLRAVSTLLGVEFEELLMRDTVRRVRNGVMQGVAAMAAVAALCSGIWYNMEHSKYYSAVAFRNEIPVGVYQLSDQERSGTAESYKLTTRRGKVVRLERVNTMDVPTDSLFNTTVRDYAVMEYEYNEGGQLIAVIQKDTTGREVTRKSIAASEDANEMLIDFVSPSSRFVQALSANMASLLNGDLTLYNKSEITRYYNTYDEEGRLLHTVFQRNNLGEPGCDSNGVYGKAYEYNEQGLITCISNLDQAGNLFDCKYGWAYQEIVYDAWGREVFSQYYDSQGNKATGERGYCAAVFEYDDHGNVISSETLDTEGQLTYSVDEYAVVQAEYDKKGRMVSTRCLGTQREPVNNAQLMHEIRYVYDAHGRELRVTYYDTQGQPVYSPVLYCASMEWKRDRDGRILEERYLDAQGQPTPERNSGAYAARCTYDKKGLQQSVTCLDGDGKPMMSRYGYATKYIQRDRDGRVIREEMRDTEGNLVRSRDNCAVLEYSYDVFGNHTAVRVYDEDGTPCRYASNQFAFGYAVMEMTYSSGKVTSRRYLDEQGSPAMCSEYFHEVHYEYDATGNCIRETYYDTTGALVNRYYGYAILENTYDTYGNVIHTRCFDTTGSPAWNREWGAYGLRYTYSRTGQLQKTEYLDAAGNLMVSKAGYASQTVTRDDMGHALRTECRDGAGKLVRGAENWAVTKSAYDALGNLVRISFYDENEQPCYHSDGYAAAEYDYAQGQQTSARYFDTAGEPMLGKDFYHETRWEYDEKGDCVEIRYLDTAGNLINIRDGYAREEQEHDDHGHLTKMTCYMADGSLASSKAYYGWERVYDIQDHLLRETRYTNFPENLDYVSGELEYDSWGNVIQRRLYDENGAPIASDQTAFQSDYTYDVYGNCIRAVDLLGTDLSDPRILVMEKEYDAFGNHVLQRLFRQDRDGNVVPPVFVQRHSYDAFGNCICTEYLNENGEPVRQSDGEATVKRGYSPQGQKIWEEYYDETGAPCLHANLGFRYVYRYTAGGLVEETNIYGLDGLLSERETGRFATVRYEYDPRGLKTQETFLNEHGEPVSIFSGVCRKVYEWDGAGMQIGETFYNASGEAVRESRFYISIVAVMEGSQAQQLDIQPGDILIQVGDWNYYDDNDFSAQSDLLAELARSINMERDVVTAAVTEDGTFQFHRYTMQPGSMGISIEGEMGYVHILEWMQDAYTRWMAAER